MITHFSRIRKANDTIMDKSWRDTASNTMDEYEKCGKIHGQCSYY